MFFLLFSLQRKLWNFRFFTNHKQTKIVRLQESRNIQLLKFATVIFIMLCLNPFCLNQVRHGVILGLLQAAKWRMMPWKSLSLCWARKESQASVFSIKVPKDRWASVLSYKPRLLWDIPQGWFLSCHSSKWKTREIKTQEAEVKQGWLWPCYLFTRFIIIMIIGESHVFALKTKKKPPWCLAINSALRKNVCQTTWQKLVRRWCNWPCVTKHEHFQLYTLAKEAIIKTLVKSESRFCLHMTCDWT